MSHFNLENQISNLQLLDQPITKGPAPRWQRKVQEATCSNVNMSLNASKNISMTSKTPLKGNMSYSANMSVNKTPSDKRNSRSPMSASKKTPGKSKTPKKTPSGLHDRFIPNRSATQYELAHYLIANNKEEDKADAEALSPTKREFQRAMSENLNGGMDVSARIVAYRSRPPSAPEGHQNNLKVLYSCSKTPGSSRKTTRHIPQVPERILDAPDIVDDYYLNLLDWSATGYLAVALGGAIYLWNASSGEIQQLMEMEGSEDYVTCVSWVKEGNYLAVGTSNTDVQLWDVDTRKRLRVMGGHAARVGALSWNSYVLSSGSRSGAVHHHDVRLPQHHIATLAGHTQEVCGLRWSPDGRHLASGGNDNLLNVWDGATSSQSGRTAEPLYTFTQHQAAVKALAWCPWQPSLLASGGGTADRHIRFWNVNTGACVSSVDTKSQVCSILWSEEYKELITGHGFAQNQLAIWKYPQMNKVAELVGHTARVLHMAMSPDGSTVVSAAADETLRLWNCFMPDAQKKKEKVAEGSRSTSMMRRCIR
ncbi:PREDICTED: cell division cycle protein 20 homolog [Priapulus caudatus]|uniref:Cell division cycle protein 20 homolog n=1 Tax=Priapulus caudatus TaxID=37621 RepID=A0ABM1EMB1_PRICU|nr:PREDICTED: cell division cycle protein 20 homolog [Priapulus caudatus]